MGLVNKKKMLAGMLILFLCFSCITVYAADRMMVVETYTGESEAVLYLKGMKGELSDIRVQAGTTVCDSVTQSRLSESSQLVKTLIMLDNSLSIPKTDRKQISTIIRNLIADRMENEQMALATFDEGLAYLSEYTQEDALLLEAAEEITYKNSHTYLTDVLYDAISDEYVQPKEDVFFRIIVISDGMDNKSIGYTKEELFSLLEEYPVPVYTVGVQTSKKNNNKQLKNMFVISRLTGAQSFLLGEMKNLLELNEAVNEDRSIIRLSVMPQQELMDGSRKTIKITLPSGKSVSAEMVMPQQVKAAGGTSADTETKADAGEQKELQKEEVSNGKQTWLIVLLAAGVLLAAIAAAVIMIIVKKRKKQNAGSAASEQMHQSDRNSSQNTGRNADRGQAANEPGTEILRAPGSNEQDGTVLLWNNAAPHCYQMTLTDMHASSRFFQIPLRGAVIIGRKQGVCSLVIDYDMSVSGRHCEIRDRGGKFYISDLQSSNGTYVNNLRISSETEITSGSTIRMGKLEFRFDVR